MQYREIKISDKYRKTSCDKDEIKLSATLVYLYCVLRLFVLKYNMTNGLPAAIPASSEDIKNKGSVQ